MHRVWLRLSKLGTLPDVPLPLRWMGSLLRRRGNHLRDLRVCMAPLHRTMPDEATRTTTSARGCGEQPAAHLAVQRAEGGCDEAPDGYREATDEADHDGKQL